MPKSESTLHRVARGVEEVVDRATLRLKRRLELFDEPQVLPFRGHGTPETIELMGRVVEQKGVTRGTDDQTLLQNLLNTLHREESDEIPEARLRARFGGRTYESSSDHEGFFRFHICPEAPLAPGWHEIEVELLDSMAGGAGQRASGRALVPHPDAEFGIISDLDDTVVRTQATDRLEMARIILTNNARTRLPLPGVAALYRALQSGPDRAGRNPLFYLSMSGWNLFDLFADFLDIHDIPEGPLFLHDTAIVESPSPTVGQKHHKRDRIRSLLQWYPELRWVLIGDSGQQDPENYLQIVREHPDRIRAVYIRDVSSDERDQEVHRIADEAERLGVPMRLAGDSVAVAEHAAAHGLIAPEAVEEVRAQRDAEG